MNSTRPEALAPEFSWRTLRLLNAFRLLYCAFLFALFIYPSEPRFVGDANPELFLAAILSGFVFAAVNDFAANQHWPSVRAQALAQGLMDIAVVSALTWASGGLASGLGNLLIITIGALSFISTRVRALAYASMATLAMLGLQIFGIARGTITVGDVAPAGLFGALLMMLAFAAAPLARRIHESEALARQRGVDLENLNQLNEYIVQNLRESIVVLDGDNRIRLMNEAAAKYLGIGPGWRGIRIGEVSPRLDQAVAGWREAGMNTDQAGAFPSADGTTLIAPIFAPIGRPKSGALLVFLEDTTIQSEKAQQAKLAALGRLSASVAHEIRNPVGALSHAAQLLGEAENLDDPQKRLTAIIENNTVRVSNIVENILQLSRREQLNPQRIDLVEWCKQFVEEFAGSADLPTSAIDLDISGAPVEVRMDPGHLHQVVTNLAENALRYGQGAGEKFRVELAIGRRAGTDRPYLEVRDRGQGIAPELADRVFEPFFRAPNQLEHRDGSGLGLFISRELCEVNRAALVYEPRHGGGTIFRIIFADPQRWET
ncbi:ATP-binding protein [Wenzhouxiangella sp. XN24]|uniref:two-component system sensor histidine kinase NtrB n=1 Tax=Wenzhouxiangella sp. XN24 TaxID=2713569 RepID=UPI0013E9E7A4|nr:ATP-binding protein [Wenzhouxiangella sp. XN24]NGX15243.1 PAS domain-containing protein [Wenzhouxiangella sp. XN24]